MDSKLSKYESFIYFSIWIIANIYSLWTLIQSQNGILSENHNLETLSDLKKGWYFLPRMQDDSDIEWASWKYFIQTSWYYFIIQFFISEMIRQTQKKILKYWYITSGMLYVNLFFGHKQLLIILTQPIIYATILYLRCSRLVIWTTSIFLLLSYNVVKYINIFWIILDDDYLQDEQVYLILFCVAWVELRCISFCIDFIEKREKAQITSGKKEKPSFSKCFLDMNSYIFYAPLLYNGPLVLHEEFDQSFYNKPVPLHTRLKIFVQNIIIYTIYSILLDLAFHYIYFFAMQSNMELIRKLPTLALCGGGLWMGLEFHMKYVIFYGTMSSFAKLDNIDAPPTPRCIVRVHVYSQMWRYFDVGLYNFLIRYIYKPILNTMQQGMITSKLRCKLVASFFTFCFVFAWHGIMWDIFLWSILNYLGIICEYFGKEISNTETYKQFKEKVLMTKQMETRMIALLCVPLLALSAVSNFYLFAGTEVGNLFFEYFYNPTLLNSLTIYIALYSCCHVSIALENVSSRTDVKNAINKS